MDRVVAVDVRNLLTGDWRWGVAYAMAYILPLFIQQYIDHRKTYWKLGGSSRMYLQVLALVPTSPILFWRLIFAFIVR